MDGWIKIAGKKSLGPGRSMRVSLDGEDVAIFRQGNEFFAVSNVCPHQHFARIYEGRLGDRTVTCPMHGWTFDLRTGACLHESGHLRTFELKEEGDDLFVRGRTEG
ncbi:MAG: Rieske 2Fe-2S domain-containing protein [Ignavibacteriales bacterium]|nr:Rieske 2Fe-2S domain-containing protein [Ignavibacteriales bacterium]